MVWMLKGEKEKVRVCFLLWDFNNEFMWFYYVEGYKGVVIGVEVDCNWYKVCFIDYGGLY